MIFTNHYYSAKFRPILIKFDRQVHNKMPDMAKSKPEVKIQNPRWRPPPCWFYVKHYNSAEYRPILIKFGRRFYNDIPYWANTKPEVNIQNPRWWPPPCWFYINHYNSAKLISIDLAELDKLYTDNSFQIIPGLYLLFYLSLVSTRSSTTGPLFSIRLPGIVSSLG